MATRAMLLCAGFGTRLGPLSDERPKPLLPMLDVPLVRYGAALATGHGIADLVVNLHHHGDQFTAALGDGGDFGARIRYSREDPILGTGGGLKAARGLLDPDGTDAPFVSMNGKLVIDADLTALLAHHRAAEDRAARAGQRLLGTMVVRRVPDALSWGAVEVDGDGWVRNILGNGRHMFCGVHVTRPSVVGALPDGEACMVRQGYLPWMQDGRGVVAAFEHDGYFAEHSTPARYLRGNVDLLAGLARGQRPLAHPPAGIAPGISPGARIAAATDVSPAALVADGAIVEAGARIGPGTVVGRGATIAAGAHLERTVVWPAARAEGRLADTIVTATGAVPAAPATDDE